MHEPLKDVQPWRENRFAVWDQITLPPGATRQFDFGGEPISEAPRALAQFKEDELVWLLAPNEPFRVFLAQALGLPVQLAWFWVGEQRHALLPNAPAGKPGDFDVIAGVSRDGVIATDVLCGVEVKRRRIAEEGQLRAFPSGLGTSQATGLTELGFDRALLLHCLVSERGARVPGVARTWQGLHAADNLNASRASVEVVRRGPAPPYGLMTLELGHCTDVDPRRTLSAFAHLAWPPPTRPFALNPTIQNAADRLRDASRKRLGEHRPHSSVLFTCRRCGTVRAWERRCGERVAICCTR
jgi:hypothetical protein